ncbi:MAG: exo-alpha-sialidase, partial [Melioribacteraceae bacterium]|nr:exo-alpha-sialidase [Melioribacteraceae bacterium]
MSNGRILLTYKFKRHQLIYSDDNGISWSDPIELPAEEGIIRPRLVSNSSLTETSDGKIWFVYSRSNTAHTHSANVFSIKSEDGQTWAAQRDTLIDNLNFTTHGTVISANPDSLLLFYQHAQPGDRNDIYKKVSTDGGESWSEPVTIIDTVLNKFRPRIIKQFDGSIWIFYQAGMETPFEEFDQVDIFYSVSRDNGETWSEPNKFTQYVGFDGWHNVGLVNDEPFVSFVSSRGQQLITNRIWYGTSSSIDTYTPPVIYSHNFTFINNYPLININVKVKAFDDNAIASLYFNYKLIGGELTELEMFDDGLHNDELPGDHIYGNIVEGLPYQYNLDYFFVITDIDANTAETITNNLSSPFNDPPTIFTFDNNNIWLPINNYGKTADVSVTSPTGEQRSMGWFDESRFIYSGGFALSGYNNGELWANGVMSSSRVEDYRPGKVGSNPGDDINRIYVLRSSHPPFTLSWLEWTNAVELGANFYDGDGDGIYLPVDLNENGEWDPNEDRPDLIGGITAWCVYNDAVPSEFRNFENVAPQGIEIKQTVFSYNKNDSPELSNAIFIRYNIENTGTVSDKFDSVYFAGWADGDLGEYNDDLVGTDTLLNSIYMYNEGPDGEYGNNPPTFYLSQLQGAHSYIPGETFIDINGNGLYEDGIDTPLDTANVLRGEIIGIKEYPGAKNVNITSSYSLRSGHPTAGDSDNEIQLRYNMEGKDQRGLFLDPCQWEYAQVIDEDCNSINPAFWYSGDPVINKGWICIEP